MMRATMMRALARSGSAHSFLTTAVSTAFSETAADRRQARLGRSRLPRGWSARTTAPAMSSVKWAACCDSWPAASVCTACGIPERGHRPAPAKRRARRTRFRRAACRLDVDRPAPAAAQGVLQVSAQPTSQIREVRSVRRPALRPKHGREQAGDRCETPVLPLIRC